MRLTGTRLANLIIGIILFISCSPLLQPLPVEADDIKWPDFSKINGKIEGYSLPLVEGPYINGGRSKDGYLNLSCTYRSGSDMPFREIVLYIGYVPDPYYLFKGGMPERIEYESKYGPGYGGASGLKWLEEMRSKDYFHEIQVENTAKDRFSLLYQYKEASSNIPWNGLRVLTYHEKYVIRVEGEGKGWNNDAEFLKDFDMAEQYAKDAIDNLEGGFSLKHYAPLDYLKAGGGYDHRPAGDLIARLTDKDGKPVKNEYVLFYVEPGTTLEKVMALSGDVPPFAIADVLGKNAVTLGHAITDADGVAQLNYLWPTNLIRTDDFSNVMLEQRYLYNEQGKVGGTVHAAVIDMKDYRVLQEATVNVDFTGIAKIVRITGVGRTQEFKDAYVKQYPDSPTWGPGRVRVKRSIVLPHFDYMPVEEGFRLMPGDVIDIDGGVEVEIVWITGDRAIARVPDKVQFGDTEVRPSHSRMILSTSSYDSGFKNTWDKIKGGIFGFSVGQGIDILGGLHPVAEGVKKTGEFCVNIYDALKEVDYTDQNLITKIRIRSIIRINTLGEQVQVQTIEGSPEILTASGQEVVLNEKQMVTVSYKGAMGEKTSYDPSHSMAEWSGTINEWQAAASQLIAQPERSLNSKGEGRGASSTGIIIGAVVAVVLIGGILFVLSKRRR
jgi:hypothetical protein